MALLWLKRIFFPVLAVIAVMFYGYVIAVPPKKLELYGSWQRIDQASVTTCLNNFMGQHQHFFSPYALREQLLTVPWVKDVLIRRYPDSLLVIKLQPIQAAARLGSQKWLGRFGEVVHSTKMSKVLLDLPIFDGSAENYQKMLDFYYQLVQATRHLSWRVKQLSYSSLSTQWTVQFTDNIVVRLGQDRLALRHLQRWLKAVAILRSKHRKVAGHYYDMRYPDGFAVGSLTATAKHHH